MKPLLTLLFFLLAPLFAGAGNETVLLTSIARDAILESLTHEKHLDRAKLIKAHPFLAEDAATFVTLTERGRLRGCIGSLRAHRALYDDIVENARSAAFSDSRFYPLKPDEYDRIEVEVSVLTPPQKVEYRSVDELRKIVVPGEDGIVLKMGGHRATYLPQVWNDMHGFDAFFGFLCLKAGLGKSCLQMHPEIYRYRVRKFSESDLRVLPAAGAGMFYPESCMETERLLRSFESRAVKGGNGSVSYPRAKAIVVPHAGYRYSGYTADRVYRAVAGSDARRIVVLGPSHYVRFRGLSTPDVQALKTPCGLLPTDPDYVRKLRRLFPVGSIGEVHEKEHSTDVQLPFVRRYLPCRPVVELVYGSVRTQTLEDLVRFLLDDPDNLLIVSTDLSHYYPLKKAHRLDFKCLDAVTEYDERALRSCEACGKPALAALIGAAKAKGLKSKLIDYRTSADSSGDRERVVGYMGAVLY